MSITVLVNGRAGAAPRAETVREALSHAGVAATVETVAGGSQLHDRAARAAARGDVLVAAGGDGTVSMVASVAAQYRVSFGVLPLGTLNHFARDAGIPGDTAAAAAALSAPTTRAVDLGEINGHTFINNASLGMYPRFVWERDAARQSGRRKWTAFAIAVLRAWRRYRTLTVRLRIDGRDYIRRTPFVFIGNGRYESEGVKLGARSALDTGSLSVFVAPYCGRFDLLRVALRALADRLEAESQFESFEGREVTIDTGRKDVSVALDGEVVMLAPPLRCTIHPGALRLIAPNHEPQNQEPVNP